MAINMTLFPTEAPADIFLADGTLISVDPQQEKSVQIPSGSFCTIVSTAGSEETSEHPPTGAAFAERMIAFWTGMMDKARDAAGPQATPL